MLKRLRMKAKLTQRKLAELAGVSQAHVAKIELGKVDPRLSTINKILGVLTEGEKRRCKDVMADRVLFAKPNDSILKVSEVMMRHAISQMPVLVGNRVVGTIMEKSIIKNLSSNMLQGTEKSLE